MALRVGSVTPSTKQWITYLLATAVISSRLLPHHYRHWNDIKYNSLTAAFVLDKMEAQNIKTWNKYASEKDKYIQVLFLQTMLNTFKEPIFN